MNAPSTTHLRLRQRAASLAVVLATLCGASLLSAAPSQAFEPAPGGFATWHRVPTATPAGAASVLAHDAAGRVLYADSENSELVRIDPVSKASETFDLGPDPMEITSLVEGPDGNFWFGDDTANAIGRLDPRSGSVSSFPISGRFASSPKSIVAASSSLYFGDAMGRGLFEIELDGTMHLIPEPSAHDLRQLTRTTDGRIWYTIQASTSIGSYDPVSGTFESHPIPMATSEIVDIEVTPRGDIWASWHQGIAKLSSAGHVVLSKAFAGPAFVTPGSLVAGEFAEMYFTDGEGGLGFVDAAANPTFFTTPFADRYSYTITVDSYGALWTNGAGGYLDWS